MRALPLMLACVGLSVSVGAEPLLSSEFSGAWVLDAARSDSTEAIAKYLGISPLVRGLASKAPEQRLTVGPNTLTIRTVGLLGTTETLVLDGKTPAVLEMMGLKCKVTAAVLDGGVVVSGVIDVEGVSKPMQSKRWLEAGALRVETVIGAGADSVTLRRTFVRKAP
jgi:hypothetical protein